MQSMLPFKDFSEEKGLRPQRAAPQEGNEDGQEQEREKRWKPTEEAPHRYFKGYNPMKGRMVKSGLVESDEIESSLASRLQSSHLALVSLESSLPNMS